MKQPERELQVPDQMNLAGGTAGIANKRTVQHVSRYSVHNTIHIPIYLSKRILKVTKGEDSLRNFLARF